MTEERLDPRINPYRPDLANSRLRGRVAATRFVDGMLKRVRVPSVPLRAKPGAGTPYASELFCGELFRVYADTEDGWSWGQNQTDGYVGFLHSKALGPANPEPTHKVSALRTFVYPGPEIKAPPVATLSIGSRVVLGSEVEVRGTVFRLLADGDRAIFAPHVEPIDVPPAEDYVAIAEGFINIPYLWGGRTSLGLDCSALVQLSLMEAGIAAPRDTDMQQDALGTSVEGGLHADLHRGDLIFWPGHVAIVAAPDRIVHASGHHMVVVNEPLGDAVARIGAIKGGPAVVKRLSA